MAVRIIAIRKAGGQHYDPHEAVSDYKWLNESTGETAVSSRPTMVNWMLNKNGQAYVSSQEGTVYCEVRKSTSGTLFLQTNTDRRSSNNLLNLPEC
ncbi:MAG: DUF3892 domain-containing protein [Candidatus Saccharimonadales bacterium]